DRDARLSGRASFPEKMYLDLVLPASEPVIHGNFCWFGKPPTRLPEALWLTFRPITSSTEGWTLDKSGEDVSPSDVVTSGNRQMHAVGTGIRYRDGQDLFALDTLDAPVIALGEKSPLAFSRDEPDLAGGIHCSLFNNAWGTNYVQWFGEDMRFRFVLRFAPGRGGRGARRDGPGCPRSCRASASVRSYADEPREFARRPAAVERCECLRHE